MYYVYALKSLDNNDLYIGFSKNLKTRINAHNCGRVKSTKPYRPWKLVYYEAYYSNNDARKREYQLKQSCYKEELKKRITESLKDWESWGHVAKWFKAGVCKTPIRGFESHRDLQIQLTIINVQWYNQLSQLITIR